MIPVEVLLGPMAGKSARDGLSSSAMPWEPGAPSGQSRIVSLGLGSGMRLARKQLHGESDDGEA